MFLAQKKTGSNRSITRLVKVQTDGIRETQAGQDLPSIPQGSQRPPRKSQRISGKIIIVENRPRPADHRIGVNVWQVGKAIFVGQLVSQADNGGYVVQTEGVGRAHRGNDTGNLLAALDD